MRQILIVDDHPLVREALHCAIQIALPHSTILEAGSIDEACRATSLDHSIDIVLFDLMLPGVSGLDGLMTIRAHLPRAPVLVFSALDDAKIVAQALRLGAAGFVPKSASKAILAEAILEVLKGEIYVPAQIAVEIRSTETTALASKDLARRIRDLSPCQIRVLQLVRQGLLNKQIAHELGICETTVKAHITAILRKLNVVSRTQIVIETSRLDFDAILRTKGASKRSHL